MREHRDPDGFPRMPSCKSVAALKEHLATLPTAVACDDELLPPDRNPLAQPLTVYGRTVGNRFPTHPMEGWDVMPDGKPSDLTVRRWTHFGISGAKLIRGGEATAVCPDGRANPNQLCYSKENEKELAVLLAALKAAHRERFGTTDDLFAGLQLTHSGRLSRPEPDHLPRPRIACRHPILDARLGIVEDNPVFADGELEDLVQDYVAAARFAARPLNRRRRCRTFSDCTTGPRNRMVSGCFPLDLFCKVRPEAEVIKALERKLARWRGSWLASGSAFLYSNDVFRP